MCLGGRKQGHEILCSEYLELRANFPALLVFSITVAEPKHAALWTNNIGICKKELFPVDYIISLRVQISCLSL